MTDIATALRTDHDAVRTEFARIITGWQWDPASSGQAFAALTRYVSAHTDFMDRHVHPLVELDADAAGAVTDAEDDEQTFAELVERAAALDPRDREWLTMVQEMQAFLERRFRDDDTIIIPTLERQLSRQGQEQLEAQHQRRMDGLALLSSLHS